jgi:hypothetical protein
MQPGSDMFQAVQSLLALATSDDVKQIEYNCGSASIPATKIMCLTNGYYLYYLTNTDQIIPEISTTLNDLFS